MRLSVAVQFSMAPLSASEADMSVIALILCEFAALGTIEPSADVFLPISSLSQSSSTLGWPPSFLSSGLAVFDPIRVEYGLTEAVEALVVGE